MDILCKDIKKKIVYSWKLSQAISVLNIAERSANRALTQPSFVRRVYIALNNGRKRASFSKAIVQLFTG